MALEFGPSLLSASVFLCLCYPSQLPKAGIFLCKVAVLVVGSAQALRRCFGASGLLGSGSVASGRLASGSFCFPWRGGGALLASGALAPRTFPRRPPSHRQWVRLDITCTLAPPVLRLLPAVHTLAPQSQRSGPIRPIDHRKTDARHSSRSSSGS